ncbi:hypothetical protein GCM10009836_07010 [Pseudonocardia ailaonensis]|uniref:Uncharacterized protein n=1 Tax=Pseudonocardia ailaonensis TaxID=367279 RepID=A0ABN2MMM4_9PSEU
MTRTARTATASPIGLPGLLRSLRDVGGAAWLGGSLMGATGLNAAADAAGPGERDVVVQAGWARWTPIFRVAALSHLAGAVGLLATERSAAAAGRLGLSTAAAGAVAAAVVVGGREDSDDNQKVVHALEYAVPGLLAAAVLSTALSRR